MFSLGKSYHFAAAHTLRSPQLTETENERVYGRCAHPAGHGHDYRVEIILCGETLTDDVLFGHGQLDDLVASHVAPKFAYCDLGVTFGPGFMATGENLVRVVQALLQPHLPGTLDLTVRLVETEKNAFAYHRRP